MRGVLLSAALLALGVAAAPAQAADVTIKNFAFDPTPITIAPGDTVTWHWAGPDTNHSVTSDEGSADTFDSDPLMAPSPADHPPGDTFDHTFATAGTFLYHCKVHSSMHGKVVVEEPGSGPPPDTTAPAVTALKAKGGRTCKKHAKHCKPKPTKINFSLSEDAQVKLTVKKVVISRAMKAGSNKVAISTKKLPPGKYTATVVATDSAGNASTPAQKKLTVKRG